jgi:hypothetical protein
MVDAGLSIEAGAGDAELPAQAVDVSELLLRQAGAAAILVAVAASPSLPRWTGKRPSSAGLLSFFCMTYATRIAAEVERLE